MMAFWENVKSGSRISVIGGFAIVAQFLLWMVPGVHGEAFTRHPGLNLPAELPTGEWSLSENAFGNTFFRNPIAIAHAPGEEEYIYVVQRSGVVYRLNVLTHDREIFLSMGTIVDTGGEGGILGLAFSPDYQTNGEFYLFYTLQTSNASGNGFHTRLSRFRKTSDPPARISLSTEEVLISQYNQARNHNGGDIHFGPDGYLYVALGDEGGGNDAYNNSQRIDKDFFAGILRIDVDENPENLEPNAHPASIGGYRVPQDNPFVDATTFRRLPVNPKDVRTEFWAVGLRNPWRMSFDHTTGLLYAADVGQSAREEINIIVKGGNYGWSFREGFIRGPRFTTNVGFIDPIYDYSRGFGSMQGNSVTGGVVYRGNKYPDLFGKYIFADYVSGNVWALESDGSQKPVDAENLVRNFNNIAGFSHDPQNGDILAIRLSGGPSIARLTRSEPSGSEQLPDMLSEVGIFQSIESLTTREGVIPYSLNQPFWSDHAIKSRWVVPTPNSQLINLNLTDDGEAFPAGTAWVKHFEMEMEGGNPDSRRRLETRIIVKTPDHVYGVTYKWNESQTDAQLVAETGEEETLTISRDGEMVDQVWRYPSRSECLHCHSKASSGVLGFNRFQLDKVVSVDSEGISTTHQIEHFVDGEIATEIGTSRNDRIRIVSLDDVSASLGDRVASYLHVNCAPCHQPGGPSVGTWDARITTPLWRKNILFGSITRPEDEHESAIVHPGDKTESALFNRMASLGHHRMPPIGSNVIDQNALDIIGEWISASTASFTKPARSWEDFFSLHFDRLPDEVTDPTNDPDGDNTPTFLEFLLETDPTMPESGWKFETAFQDGALQFSFPPIPSRGLALRIEMGSSPEGPWEPIPSPETMTPDPKNPWSFQLQVPDGNQTFFRVTLAEPI